MHMCLGLTKCLDPREGSIDLRSIAICSGGSTHILCSLSGPRERLYFPPLGVQEALDLFLANEM